ncbi:hypothetical protein ACOMHN_013717 [Nucella lapillus]
MEDMNCTMELEESATIIRQQAERILHLENELERVTGERDDLLRKLSDLTFTVPYPGETCDEASLVAGRCCGTCPLSTAGMDSGVRRCFDRHAPWTACY